MATTGTAGTAGTGGQPATAGAGQGTFIGTVFSGSGSPKYLGQDGQMHQYTGADAQGNYLYDPNFPPANAGTGPQGGAGAGSTGSGPQGIVASLGPLVGELKTGTAILLGLVAVLGVALEIITVGTAIFWLAAFLALDIGLGLIGDVAQKVENFFGGDPNEPGISPITKAARQLAQMLGLGGLMGDFVITAAIGGALYYYSRRGGKTTIQVVQRRRSNPAGRRPMKRVGPKIKKRK